MARPLRGGGRLWVQHVRSPARPRSPGILLRLGSVSVAAGGPLAQAQPQGVGAAEFGLDFIQERIQVFRHLEQARAGGWFPRRRGSSASPPASLRALRMRKPPSSTGRESPRRRRARTRGGAGVVGRGAGLQPRVGSVGAACPGRATLGFGAACGPLPSLFSPAAVPDPQTRPHPPPCPDPGSLPRL